MIQTAASRRQRTVLLILALLILFTLVLGMGTGAASLSYDRILPTLLGRGTVKESFILFSIRLPRILVTLLAGMALSLSGAILQSITKNDLADPGIMGINSGAGVAITVLFLYFPVQTGAFAFMLPFVGFLGAVLTAAAIYACSYERGKRMQPIRLVLTGIGFSTALSGLMVVMISSAERLKVEFISRWIAGNIWGTDWPYILAILPWLLVLIPFTLYKANRMNILGLSEPVAVGLGLPIEKERIQLLFSSVALAAAAVSVTGGIAFVGLMAPHLAKRLVGPRNQLSIPVALLLGGWFLVFADMAGRFLVQPDGIPAGIMAALIGAPYFILLLLRKPA